MIIKQDLSDDYINETTKKEWIVLHGTSGGSYMSADSTLDIKDKINVHYAIDRDGTIYKRFDEKYWAYHTGTKAYCKKSIGIELVCWNNLEFRLGKYYTWTGKVIPENEVVKVNLFRGVKYFHCLTDAQIKAVKELVADIKTRHSINKIVYHSALSTKRTDFPPDYNILT